MTNLIDTNIQKVKLVVFRQLHDINTISGINSLILSVCLVDALAGFYCGYTGQFSGNEDRYKQFTDKYLPEYSDYIYKIRCDLAHSFSNTLSKYYFIDDEEFTTVFGNSINILDKQTFNIDHFRKALQNATNSYFTDLNCDLNLKHNFSLRFNYADILGDGQIGTVRNLAGKMVSNYEHLDTLPGLDLKIAIVDPTNTKQ